MKNLLTHFSKIRGLFSASQCSDVGYDCCLTVVRPLFDCRSTVLKLCSVLAILLTVGVGNAWGANIVIDLDLTKSATYPGGFPTSSGTTSGTYTFGGYSFGFSCNTAVYRGSTGSGSTLKYYILIGKAGATENTASIITFPAIADYKLTEVKLTVASTSGENVAASIRSNWATILSGGTSWTFDAGQSNTWTLSSTAANTAYTMYIIKSSGNKTYNGQLAGLKLTYEPAASCADPTAPSNSSINQTTAQVSWTDGANASNGYYVAYSSLSSETPGDITSSNATYTVHTISSGTKSDEFTSLTCGTTYHWWVRSNCGGSTSAWVAGTDISTSACTTPAITVSPSSLTNLNYIVGNGPSAAQNITLGGSYLTGNLTVTAPTNFEVSIDGGSTYGDSKSVTVTSGSPTVSTIKVRLKSGLSVGSYGSASTYVTVEGGSATTQNVSVTGSVLKPTITADPTSITGWNAETGSAPSPSTKTVSVTGVNLKANISASLTSGGDYFTITPASITQTSGSASGSITIGVKAAAYASAATRNGNLRLTTTDGDNVDVPITLVVADDPRERFELLTTSNVGDLSDGAKLVLVNPDRTNVMNTTYDSGNGHKSSTSGFEFLSSNTIIALAVSNDIEVLTLVDQGESKFALKTLSDDYIYYSSGNKFSQGELPEPVTAGYKWAISVDANGKAVIASTYQLGYNANASASPFRAYSSGYTIYAYFQPSTTPSVSLTSVSKMEYDYGSGPSDPQTATLSGKNLTANLTVTAPTNFEVRKGTTGDYSSSITVTSSEALAGQTIQIRLKGNLGVNTYAGNLSVSGTDLDAAKTFALSGEVNCLSYAAGPVLGAVTAVNDHATITWSAVAGASEYEVKLGTGEWTDANGSLSHEFTSLTCGGTSYTYYVRAKAATGYCDASAATSSSFTTGDCLCSNFSFHWGNSSSNTTTNWSSMNFRCFTQVGSSHEWQIENFVIGNTTDMNKFAVGWQNTAQDNLAYGSRTAVVTLESELFFAGTQSCGDGKRPTVRYGAKTAEGAIGTLRMYDNHDTHHDWNNCYVGFIPNGYGLMYGGSTATGNSLTMHATGNTNEWETEIAILTSDMLLTNNTCKYQVGILTNSGTYVDCGNSNPDNFGSMGSFYSSDWRGNVSTYSAGQAGKFQIWTGDCDGNVNWRCHFVPYYTINYYDLDDELIGTDYVVYGTASTTLRTVSGLGWKNTSSGDRSAAGSVTNTFGSSLTLSTSQTAGTYNFYLVAPGYTVTFSVPACASVTPTSVTSNSVTLPTPTGTPDGYTFAGWTTATVSPTTTAPTLYAAGSTYNPTAATTLYACYYSTSGDAGTVSFDVLKNSAAITAGYYVLTPNKSGEAEALYNTFYNNTKLNVVEVDGSGSTATMSASEEGAVWQFIADGDYWQIKNMANNKYLAAVNDDTGNKIALVDAVSNNYAKWVVNLRNGYAVGDTHTIYNVGKGSSGTGSDTKHWFLHQYTATSTEVWAANEIKDSQVSTNGAVIYLFKATGTPSFGVTYTYTTSPTCKFVVSVASVANATISMTSPSPTVTEGNNSGARITSGTTVTLSGEADECRYNFAWNVTRDDNGATVSVNGSNQFTMPESDVTVSATITDKATHTVTYTIPSGGGSAVTPTTTAYHGCTITLPNVTGYKAEYNCETFLGWTTTAPNAEGGTKWSSTPTIKAAGATSDAINSNTTFYAVYSRPGSGPSGSIELSCSNVVSWRTDTLNNVNNPWGTTTYFTTTHSGTKYRWQTNGQIVDAGEIQLKENYAIKIPTVPGRIDSIFLKFSQGNETNACADYPGSTTTRVVYFNSTASTTSPKATSNNDNSRDRKIGVEGDYYTGYLLNSDGTSNVHSVRVKYGAAPIISHTLKCTCEVEEFDLTYNANTTYFPGSTTSCTGVDDYAFADHDDKYTICSTEPTLSGYKFIGWNTSDNGEGDMYDAGEEVSCFGTADVTLYAQYERVYTVTFNNQGVTTPVTQASYGAAIDVPSASSACDATWAFVGWSETAISPKSLMPTLEITSGTSTYTPTEDKTLYAIYRKTSTSDAFLAGTTGAYKIKANYNSTDYYAQACNNSKLPATTTAGDGTVFYIAYTSADGGKYTIQQANGKYVKYTGSSTGLELSDDPAYWTFTANGGTWSVFAVGSSGRYLRYSNGTGFKAYDNNVDANYLSFVAAEGQYYYRTMSCATEYDITFHDNGTTINWAGGYPEASYKDLADATVVSTFPTATFDGWTFLGWRTADYDESTTAPESSGIYSTGGNALTISSADVDLYPVFTRFEDNEPFDQINGGDYYIYYLKSSTDAYGAYERVYACSYADSKRYNQTTSCASATEFTFTKEGDIWHIYDKATGKYVAGVSGDNDLVHKSDLSGDYDDWTIEVVSGNQFEASCQGGTRRLSFSTAANYFMNYETAAGPGYLPVYLGSCTERTFTTNPSITPNIEIHGEVKVTSTATKSVKAKTALTVSASNISTANLTVTSDNSAFKFSLSSNGSYTASVNIPVVSNKVGVTPIYMEYTPTATSDGIEGAIVTVSDGAGTPTSESTAVGDVQGRHLPAKFLIATKVGDDWYALPNNISGYGNPAAVKLSSVDEGTGVATYYSDQYDGEAVGSKNYLTWTLNSVVSGSDADYGYTNHGNRVRFYDSKNSKYLEFGTGDNVGKIQNNRVTSTPASVLHIASELLPTTSDLIDYTLLNEGQTKYLGVDGSKMWGAYAGSTTVRFLIPNQQPAPTLKWKNDMIDGDEETKTLATTKGENGIVVMPSLGDDPDPCAAASSILTFDGWTAESSWSGYHNSYTKITGTEAATTNNKSYYAVFKTTDNKYFTQCPNTQTVTYSDGAGNTVVETYFVDGSGKQITCKDIGTGEGQVDLSKSGYVLVGWTTSANYGSAFKYVGNTVTLYPSSSEQAYKGDLVLTAVWVGELRISGDVHLTSTYSSAIRSEANTVYTTANPNNLITFSIEDVPASVDFKLRTSYLTSGDASQDKNTCPFRLCNDGSSNYNIVDGSNLNVATGDYSQTYAIGYKPGVTGGTNGTTETYKLKMELINSGGDKIFDTKTLTLYGRVLPDHFVIAAKINGQWCALPADIATSSGSAIANAYPITVNNQTTPTVATSAPKAALYSGTVRAHNDHRGGIRLTTATGDGYDGQLQATRSDNTYLWRTTSDCTTGMQEWYLVSSNFSQYEVRLDGNLKRSTSGGEGAGDDSGNPVDRQLCVSGSQILFGKTSAKTMYILPVTEEFTPVEIQVVTWRSNAVQFMYFGNPAYTAEVEIEGVNKASAQALGTALKIDHGVYEIAVSDLMSNPNKQMHIIIKNGGSEIGRKAVTIPLMTNSATTVDAARTAAGINKGDCSGVDLVVLSNVLTADDATAHEFNSVTVYGGAKLSVTGKLTAKKMYLRAGNVTAGTKGTTPVTSYSYVYPQVYVGSSSTLTINENIINFDYLTNYDQYFGVAFPHTLTIDKNNIFYPEDIYGSAAKTGSFLMRVFDSQIRATSGAVDNVWVDVEEGSTAMPKQTTTTRGLGYYVLLPPRKVSVNGGANTRQTYGIQRMKLSVANAAALTTAENSDATIAVTAYSASSIVNTGWWMLGNPYMASLGTGTGDADRVGGASITVGSIGTNAQGQYEWKSSSVRYVTVPDDGAGDTYDQRRVIDYDFPAFKPFYVQVGASGDVTFSYASRNTAAPARLSNNSMPNEINVSVALNTAAYGDTTYLLIGDAFSAAYEIGDDLMKMPHANVSLFTIGSTYDLFANALNKQSAEAGVPVGYAAPSAGSYEFSHVETDESAWLEHLWLEDKATGTTVDLLDDSYEFETDAGTNKTRFVLFAVLKQPSETPTDIGGISDENVDKPMKFIYREKMYILRGGQIYDATGKKVKEINK